LIPSSKNSVPHSEERIYRFIDSNFKASADKSRPNNPNENDEPKSLRVQSAEKEKLRNPVGLSGLKLHDILTHI